MTSDATDSYDGVDEWPEGQVEVQLEGYTFLLSRDDAAALAQDLTGILVPDTDPPSLQEQVEWYQKQHRGAE